MLNVISKPVEENNIAQNEDKYSNLKSLGKGLLIGTAVVTATAAVVFLSYNAYLTCSGKTQGDWYKALDKYLYTNCGRDYCAEKAECIAELRAPNNILTNSWNTAKFKKICEDKFPNCAERTDWLLRQCQGHARVLSFKENIANCFQVFSNLPR